jgi:acyl-CoA thioesterase-1
MIGKVHALTMMMIKKNQWNSIQKSRTFLVQITLGVLFGVFTCNAHSATKTLLVLGDSLSAEYGLARGTGWVALMQQRLQEHHIDANVINASISGETTSGGKARLPQLLQTHHPDILILELGSNDALRGLSLSASEKNFRDMIKMAQQGKTKVLLVGMRIPPNYGRDYTEQFFSVYARVAKETHSGLVPFLLDGIAEKIALFQNDRIHPLASAHPILLNNVWPPLQSLLNQK